MSLAFNYLRDSKGEIKYYASHRSAWNKASKLNLENPDANGGWYFEMDLNGWFVHFVSDDSPNENGWMHRQGHR